MPRVLVVDDDRTVLRLVEKALSEMDVDVSTSASAAEGIEKLANERPDVVLLDMMLPETTGIEVARKIRSIDARLPVIFITVSDDSSVAIEAMKLGAYDYVLKPLGVEQVQDLVERGLETRRLMHAPVHLQEVEANAADGDTLVGRSPRMLEVYKQIGRVAAQDVSVLVRGESGTGKELIARAIYQHSHRAEGCFLAVNCAALSETLLESELFGHEKGAFTGADSQHVGKFEQCDGGTLFLDEVGDMSPLTQSKVLRLLQEQCFERVGGSETIQVDVRIISATNRDLERMIEEDDYRLDLFHRLNAFEIHLPPLRERGDDIPLLIEYFLATFNRQLEKEISGISDEALNRLLSYRWPGNIRELQGVLRKAILMSTGPVIVPEFLPAEVRREDRQSQNRLADENEFQPADSDESTNLAAFLDSREAAGSVDLHAEATEWMEKYLVTRVLRVHQGNQSKAAEQLGITRGSLRHKIKSLGISISQVVEADSSDE